MLAPTCSLTLPVRLHQGCDSRPLAPPSPTSSSRGCASGTAQIESCSRPEARAGHGSGTMRLQWSVAMTVASRRDCRFSSAASNDRRRRALHRWLSALATLVPVESSLACPKREAQMHFAGPRTCACQREIIASALWEYPVAQLQSPTVRQRGGHGCERSDRDPHAHALTTPHSAA